MQLEQIIKFQEQLSQRLIAIISFYISSLVIFTLILILLSFLFYIFVRYSSYYSNFRLFTKTKISIPKALSYLKLKIFAGKTSEVIPLTYLDSPFCEKFLVIKGLTVIPVCLIHANKSFTNYEERVSGNLMGYGKHRVFLIENPGIRTGLAVLELRGLPCLIRSYGRAFSWTIDRPVIVKSSFVNFPKGLNGFSISSFSSFRRQLKNIKEDRDHLNTKILSKRIKEIFEHY